MGVDHMGSPESGAMLVFAPLHSVILGMLRRIFVPATKGANQ
jgi:hypothetical protein